MPFTALNLDMSLQVTFSTDKNDLVSDALLKIFYIRIT